MKLRWHPEAKEDMKGFSGEVKQAVLKTVSELESEGLSHDSVGLATGEHVKLWRLKVKRGKEGVDHRVILDLEDDTLIIYGVWHRDDAYSTEMWELVRDRF